MFELLKKVFIPEKPDLQPAPIVNAVSEWAATQGLAYSGSADGQRFTLTGVVGSRPLKLELGGSTRDFIQGDELLARAELKVNEDAAIFIINRPLKNALDARAYGIYTDTLQTRADPSLPEEMRWMALYGEVGWDSLPKVFWSRYSVMADQREQAIDWIGPELAAMLVSRPAPGAEPALPFIMMLLRGKAYLRMQYTPCDLPTLMHATAVFRKACESALASFSTDISL
jgi:hypothetical protein